MKLNIKEQAIDLREVECGDIVVRWNKRAEKSEPFMIGRRKENGKYHYHTVYVPNGFTQGDYDTPQKAAQSLVTQHDHNHHFTGIYKNDEWMLDLLPVEVI